MNSLHQYMRQLCESAFDAAQALSVHGSIVATDSGGHLIVALRADRAAFSSLEAARRKAVAGAAMQASTGALSEMLSQDPLALVALHASGDMLIVPGGFPIYHDGKCVGGLGIAGGHYKQDHLIGEKALGAMGIPGGANVVGTPSPGPSVPDQTGSVQR
jgi:glc operon protein GlcG